jgi:hypothetical protein
LWPAFLSLEVSDQHVAAKTKKMCVHRIMQTATGAMRTASAAKRIGGFKLKVGAQLELQLELQLVFQLVKSEVKLELENPSWMSS